MADEPKEESEVEAPKKKGKLLIIIVALVVILAGAGGAAWFFMQGGDKEKTADGEHAEASEEEHEQPIRPRKKVKGAPPIFIDMEPFVFNLQDVDQDRFAQVGVTLEVVDSEVTAELALVEPSVRNAILLVMSSKTSKDIRRTEGKMKLAEQIIDAANAIMAGEEPPAITYSSKSGSEEIGKGEHQASKNDARMNDHNNNSGNQNHQKRRAKYIPERVLHAHFKQFIVQ